jgi:hydroxymethylpyrimidine/phosphomethylpyrimidine kinase
MIPVALTIAGSDPSGGAGIQADLKTFHQHGCYGCAVITLLTAQNTRAVKRVQLISADFVADQLDTLLEDVQPNAAKTGALGSEEIVAVVAERVERYRLVLVVDPVAISKHGAVLASDRAIAALRDRLLPLTFLVTPNREEAEVLANRQIRDRQGVRDAAKAIANIGVQAVLIKGGHGPDSDNAVDTLYWQGEFREFTSPRIDTRHTHGVGCALSAAIVAELSKGRNLIESIRDAKVWLTKAIATAPGVGDGIGAVNHHARK